MCRGLVLSGERLDVKKLHRNRAISVFIKEHCKAIFGYLTDWFRRMFESNVQVASRAKVHGHDLSRKIHSIPSSNLRQDLLQIEL